MNTEEMKDVIEENNVLLQGVCDILSNIIEGSNQGDILFCVVNIIERVIKNQTV